MSVNSRLKATKIIGQRKAFYGQRISESSCARKETIDIDILVTSRNGDRKIMQSIRITSRPPSRKRKWSQLSRFWRTSTKVIPIEKTWAGHISTMSHKGSRKAASEWPAVMHILFADCLTIPSRTYRHQARRDNSIPDMGIW